MQSLIHIAFRVLLHVRQIVQNTYSNFQTPDKREILCSIGLLSHRWQDGDGAAYRLQKKKGVEKLA